MALVLSRSTGLVSPQFHVKFDDRFQTINDISNESLWQTKAGFISIQQTPGAASQKLLSQNTRALSASEGVNIQDVDLTPTESFTMLQGGNNMAPEGADSEGVASEVAIPMSPTPEGVNQPGINKRKQPSVLKEHNPKRKTAKTHCKYNKRQSQGTQDAAKPTQGTPHITSNKERSDFGHKPPTKTKSGRHSQPANRLIEAMMSEISQNTSHDVEGEIFCLKCIYPHEHNTLENDNFMAYKATSDPDTLYLHQAMKELDKHNFIKAMEKEMEDQMKNGNFTKNLRSKVQKEKQSYHLSGK